MTFFHLATGTNASYIEDVSKIKYSLSRSIEPYPYKKMIIDTEWSGFGDKHDADYILTQYDLIIDSRAEHPNENTFVFIFSIPFSKLSIVTILFISYACSHTTPHLID